MKYLKYSKYCDILFESLSCSGQNLQDAASAAAFEPEGHARLREASAFTMNPLKAKISLVGPL